MKRQRSRVKSYKLFGFSLIEMLIVVGVFSILAVIVTQTLATSLRASRKSENLGKVRENVEYAMNYIERTLRSANRLNVSGCTPTRLEYFNNNGTVEHIEANTTGSGYIRHNGSNITNNEIRIINNPDNTPIFACQGGSSGSTDMVKIKITARDALTSGVAESAVYTAETTITLRNYSRN